MRKIIKQIKDGFKPIFDVIIPKNREEKWLLGVFFFVYLCFGFLFWFKYGDTFPSTDLLDYDVEGYSVFFSKIQRLTPLSGSDRHPLLAVIISPLIILGYVINLFFKGLALQFLLGIVFFNVIAALSITIVYKYCVNLIKISKIQSLIICLLFAFFAHVLLLSFIPESFPLSMLGLLLLAYLTTDSLLNHKKIPIITNVILFAYVAGVTVTNGLKCVIAQLFQNGDFKYKLKSILVSGLTTATLILISFVISYISSLLILGEFKLIRQISLYIFSGETHIISEMFFEPILFHQYHTFWGEFREEVFAYNTIFPTIANIIFYAVVICAIVVNIRKREVLFLLSLFGADVFFHLICGFGIDNLHIYCLHWIFIFPLLIGWLYKEINNSKIKIGLNILLLLLGGFLVVNNISQLIVLIY